MKTALRSPAIRLLRDAVFWHRPGSFRRSVAYLAVVLVAALALDGAAFRTDQPLINDGHTLSSLGLAMARAYCGLPSRASSTIVIPNDVRDHDNLRRIPLSTLVVREAGSLDAYCRTVAPYVQNENSLMLLETAILRLAPDITVAQLGETLHLIRIAGVAVFVFLLLDLGGSIALGLATILCALEVLRGHIGYVYSAYPFLFVLVLVSTAFHGLVFKYQWMNRPSGLVLCALGAGLLSAFMVNMRTSYLPIAAVYFGCFLLSEWLRADRALPWLGRGGRVVVIAVAFAAGFAALQYGLVTRSIPETARHNASHSIGHPLVLALAVPENDFSRRMGISWLDETGRQKALSVDSSVIYLGPRYDDALFRYYTSLWRTHTREMLGVYYLKFSRSGVDMLPVLRGSPGIAGRLLFRLLWPLSQVPTGIWLLAFYGALAGGSLWLFVRTGTAQALAAALLGMAACLIQIESGLIYSLYTPHYHNYLAFFAMFLSLVGLQGVVNFGGWMLLRSVDARSA